MASVNIEITADTRGNVDWCLLENSQRGNDNNTDTEILSNINSLINEFIARLKAISSGAKKREEDDGRCFRFVDEDKMTPVQLALETARFECSHLHGCRAYHPSNPSYSWPIRTTGAARRIDDALRSLGLMDTHADPHTASE